MSPKLAAIEKLDNRTLGSRNRPQRRAVQLEGNATTLNLLPSIKRPA
jgi:hypothetical protein